MDDHYATLQVAAAAPPAVIRAAYRVLTQQYHPDKNPDEPTADAILKRLNAAYAVLSDPAKRRAYDAQRQTTMGATASPAHAQTASAASATPPPVPPETALTGTVKGHTFTLRCYPARVIANTVWTETTTTTGREGVTMASTPRQQLGFRPDAGPDVFIETAGHPLPVALNQAVVLIAVQGGRLLQAEWAAVWNRDTGNWHWLGHTPESLGKAIRTRAAALRDGFGYVLRVTVSIGLLGYLIQRSGYRLAWLPLAFPVIPMLLGGMALRLTHTADAIGRAIRQHITVLVAHLENRHHA